MDKDKKAKRARVGDEVEALQPKKAKVQKADKPSKSDKAAKSDKGKKAHGDGASRLHPVETLSKFADHPLVSELLAVGALAAVAAVAEAAANDPATVKSADNARKAGKAAAAAIGARLLKEFNGAKKTVEGAVDKK